MEYPLWLPVEIWREYLKMRKAIKAPLTARGEKIAINKLDELKQTGQDPEKVIEQSIYYSWRGLFPVKDDTCSDRRFDNW